MERRTSNRTKVDIFINRFLNGHPYMCRMTDISPTGMRIVPLLEPAAVPRYMGLQFQLPGVDGVLTAAAVAVPGRRSGQGVGVRFTALPPECAQAIQKFVQP